MKNHKFFSFLLTTLFFGLAPSQIFSQDYYVYVAAESEDEVHLIHLDGKTNKAVIAKTIEVGRYPTETDGPHGINISPDGEHWFLSIAHGNPYGMLAKYKTGTDELVATTDLGMFPASMEISKSTGLLYVVNFNLHGDMVPSTVSVVDPEYMEVITDIETGIMPHGSRITDDGTKQYHVSMMTDELYEINTAGLQVNRTLSLKKNAMKMEGHSENSKEHKENHEKHMKDGTHEEHSKKENEMKEDHSGHDMSGMKNEGMKMMHAKPEVKPTWADPHPTKPLVYVAGNGSDEIIEIDTEKWEVTRRFKSGKAPYNLEVSHDGKILVASYKGEGATGIFDLESGKEIAKITNSRKVTHGVAISTDNRYAFLSVEGIGGEPGSVDIIDLRTNKRIAVVETGKQAGGIVFWKQTAP
jgi:DNA-binding beta-propeller fold protein YncE